jgi:spore maturation protein CgeB
MPGISVDLFPFDEIERMHGRNVMNDMLIKTVKETTPDLVFFFLYEDEFSTETVDKITRHTKTFNWFADDHWRFEIFSRHWAPHFTLVGTTDWSAIDRYEKAGVANVIATQWACNHHVYRPEEIERDLDVTFVGQVHGKRKEIVARAARAGISIQTWGAGWATGRLTQAEMIRVFSRSRINLNFSEGSAPRALLRRIRFVVTEGRHLVPPGSMRTRFNALRAREHPQIKGRTFEIPGCRALLLTEPAEGLGHYYAVGEEIATFETLDELVDLCRQYLRDSSEAERVATAGYERTLREHTYEHRFQEIFSQLGFSS